MNDPSAAAGDQRTGCYIHLPFCDRVCPYCDFAVVEFERKKADRYVAAIETEIRGSPTPRSGVRTIYLGGGTPSALDADALDRILRAVFERFEVAPGSIECTIEANPSRHAADLERWRRSGVTRVSVGVQSLDDSELHHLGRDHSAAEARDFVASARRAGFEDLSIDLIAGVPHQTLESFQRTVASAVTLVPDHLSVYGLTIEPGTPYATWYARDPEAFPDEDASADMLSFAHDALTEAGFRLYELSNFARPGHECAHNLGYWRQQDCIAFGLSASGYEDGVRYKNVRSYAAYCDAVEQGRSPRDDIERLDDAGRLGEAAMLALRTSDGIDRDDFRRRFGVDITVVFAQALEKCSAAGLLELDGRGARLNARGRLLANSVCAEFLTPQLAEAS